jgi:hypothetical protein
MSRNANARTFPVVLKSIISDAIKDKTIVDDNAKRIRAKLRLALADSHIRNTSWIANNQKEYDAIRCAFDARYATKLADNRKRKPKVNVEETTNA